MTASPKPWPIGGMRWLMYAFQFLSLLAFTQLFIFAGDTERFFAWTLEPPLTAAFLGAGFGAGVILIFGSIRKGSWPQARLAVITVLVYAAAMSIATILHLDRFHFSSDFASARVAAWLWVAVYAAVVLIGIPLVFRQPVPERDPAPIIAPTWLNALLVAQGAVLLGAGLWLALRPGVADWWPWQPVTPLAGRAMAAWLVPIGLAALAAVKERDLRRAAILAWSFAAFAILQFVALLRFGDQVNWQSGAGWIYSALLTTILIAGVSGVLLSWTRPPNVTA